MHPLRHFLTITRHHNLVCGYCIRAGLIRQGLLHDLSKLSPTEFIVGARYYQGDQSPNNAEKSDRGWSSAWLHHKGRNRHHFEYWIDYSPDKSDPMVLKGVRMPRKYVAEMIFDRVSASRVYLREKYTDRSPYEYFLKSRDRSWFIHEKTKEEMETLLKMWADQGEDRTIRYIRDVYLKGGGDL